MCLLLLISCQIDVFPVFSVITKNSTNARPSWRHCTVKESPGTRRSSRPTGCCTISSQRTPWVSFSRSTCYSRVHWKLSDLYPTEMIHAVLCACYHLWKLRKESVTKWSEWVSELVYLTSLLNSQSLMSNEPGAGQWNEGWKGPRLGMHQVSNPGPSGLKSSVLPLDQVRCAWRNGI